MMPGPCHIYLIDFKGLVNVQLQDSPVWNIEFLHHVKYLYVHSKYEVLEVDVSNGDKMSGFVRLFWM